LAWELILLYVSHIRRYGDERAWNLSTIKNICYNIYKNIYKDNIMVAYKQNEMVGITELTKSLGKYLDVVIKNPLNKLVIAIM